MKYVTLPHITEKQQEVFPFIYKFRFIDRIQFQQLLNEPHQPNLNTRLKDLVDKKYLKVKYEKSQANMHKPAIYYIGNIGINYLKAQDYIEPKYLKKLYAEDERSDEFIEKSRFIIHVFLTLKEQSKNLKSNFFFYTQSEFPSEGPMKELGPDFGYVYESKTKTVSYSCEIFDRTMSEGAVRYRVKEYFEFFQDEEEESHIIFICPTEHIRKIAYRSVRRLIDAEITEDNIHFSITTLEKMRQGNIGGRIENDL